MSQVDGIVHLWDLPEDKICVRLPKILQKNMIKDALSVHNLHSLSRELKINRITLYDIKNSRFKSMTLKHIVKLSKFLVKNGFSGYSLTELEKELEVIKAMRAKNAIHNPTFPINFNTENGAQVISAFLFDGGITSQLFPFYANNEELLVQKLIKNVREVVGNVDYNRRNHNRSETIQVEFPKILGYILVNGLGMIPGMKVMNNSPIPEFILHSKYKMKRVFLQQAFDDEGSVHPGRSGRSIQLCQYYFRAKPPTRLLQLKELIEKFNIPVNGPYGPTREHQTKTGYKSYGWAIQISNLPDIYRFAEKINFSLPRKINKLRELIDSYVLPPRFKKGTIKGKILEICEQLKKENERITIKDIALKLDRCETWIAEIMRALVKEEKLEILQEKSSAHTFRGGFLKKEFQLN